MLKTLPKITLLFLFVHTAISSDSVCEAALKINSHLYAFNYSETSENQIEKVIIPYDNKNINGMITYSVCKWVNIPGNRCGIDNDVAKLVFIPDELSKPCIIINDTHMWSHTVTFTDINNIFTSVELFQNDDGPSIKYFMQCNRSIEKPYQELTFDNNRFIVNIRSKDTCPKPIGVHTAKSWTLTIFGLLFGISICFLGLEIHKRFNIGLIGGLIISTVTYVCVQYFIINSNLSLNTWIILSLISASIAIFALLFFVPKLSPVFMAVLASVILGTVLSGFIVPREGLFNGGYWFWTTIAGTFIALLIIAMVASHFSVIVSTAILGSTSVMYAVVFLGIIGEDIEFITLTRDLPIVIFNFALFTLGIASQVILIKKEKVHGVNIEDIEMELETKQ